MMADNEDLGYFVPEEGTNRFVDALVIPKGSREKECAEMFIKNGRYSVPPKPQCRSA